MSFAGQAASSSGWSIRPREEEIGLTGCARRIPRSLPIGPYVMETAGHREPCDSRGSCTVLGAPRGESPPGDSTMNKLLLPSQIGALTGDAKEEREVPPLPPGKPAVRDLAPLAHHPGKLM